jgi:hypothetical protein
MSSLAVKIPVEPNVSLTRALVMTLHYQDGARDRFGCVADVETAIKCVMEDRDVVSFSMTQSDFITFDDDEGKRFSQRELLGPELYVGTPFSGKALIAALPSHELRRLGFDDLPYGTAEQLEQPVALHLRGGAWRRIEDPRDFHFLNAETGQIERVVEPHRPPVPTVYPGLALK